MTNFKMFLRLTAAIYLKSRILTKRAYPISFIIQRIMGGVTGIIFPLLIYFFVVHQKLSDDFIRSSANADYVQFIVLGYVGYQMFFATITNVGRSMISELKEGTFDTYLMTNISFWPYYLGVYMEQFVRSIVEALIILSIGFLSGMNFENVELCSFFLGLIVVSISSFAMSITVSNVMILSRNTFIVQNTISSLVSLLSGVLFPLDFMPKFLKTISLFMPITWAINFFRNITFEHQSVQLRPLVLSLLLSIIYATLSAYWHKKIRYNLIERM